MQEKLTQLNTPLTKEFNCMNGLEYMYEMLTEIIQYSKVVFQ